MVALARPAGPVAIQADDLEERTQALGRELAAAVRQQRERPEEWLQDRFLAAIAQDATLRTSLLRFVDVLAALDFDHSGRLTTRLAREYLSKPAHQLPLPFRALPELALRAPAPPALVRLAALKATTLVADRFIVEPAAGQAPTGGAGTALVRLRRQGFFPSFDVLGEHVVGDEEAAAYRDRYLVLITQLGRQPAAGTRTPGGVGALQASVKLSALTPHFDPADPDGTLARLRAPFTAILDAAGRAGIAVTVDMEEFRLRDLTWTVFQDIFGPGSPYARWPDAGIVLQAYLRDAPEQAQRYIEFARRRGTAFQVRLVKGAYWDYETITAMAEGRLSPVLDVKAATDLQFERLSRQLAAAFPTLQLAVGSHNLRSHARAEAAAQTLGLPPNSIEHQTLYGMAPHISRALRRMGWVVREYVPVGELLAGMAYLVRRILENSSQTGFLLQSRGGTRWEQLLRPPAAPPERLLPERLESAGVSPVEAGAFHNTPPVRLFVAAERERFARSLAQAEAAAPARFVLDLPASETRRPWLRPLNPSRPDPTRPAVDVEAATAADIEPLLRRVAAAAPGWAARPLSERAAILRRAAELLLAHRDALAAAIVLEGGKTWANALGDVDEAVDYLRYYPWIAQRLGAPFSARYQPRGVAAVIPPWNFPLAIPCGMTSAALVCGNAVVLKPAEQTPGISARLVTLLHEAGVPRDVLVHLPGDGEEIGGALVRSALVNLIAFTGSRDVGLWIAETAAATPSLQGRKQVVAEMGGKNAIAVFADADLDEAVAGILVSTFGHANQKCSACSRVFAHQAIFARLRRRLAEGARSLIAGPATNPGTFINPLIDATAVARVRELATQARREGKVVLDMLDAPSVADPYCLGPLLVELAPSALLEARTAQEEIFGPVLALAPFASEGEALAQINGTAYGLTAGIFSRSPATIRRMTAGIRAGNVYVNREITGARVGVEPFGGIGLSGSGPKAGGEDYLFAFVRTSLLSSLPRGASHAVERNGNWRTGGDPPRHSFPVRQPVGESDGDGKIDGDTNRMAAVGGTEPPVLAAVAETTGAVSGAVTDTVTDMSWPAVAPWQAGVAHRLGVLTAAAGLLDRGVTGAVPAGLVEALRAALRQSDEIARLESTLPIPGQHTVLDWSLARGCGLVILDQQTPPAALGSLVGAALLAGNGITLAVPTVLGRATGALTRALRRAGVPARVVATLPPGELPETVPVGHFDFIAADVAPQRAQRLEAALKQRHPGRRGIPAFLGAGDAPAAGEAGFLRRFVLARTIATRTLRHGADLAL